jgi:hypothetical protein
MKTVNLEEGMPLVRQALLRLDRELAIAIRLERRWWRYPRRGAEIIA